MSTPPDDRLPFEDPLDRAIARMVMEGAPNKVIATQTGLPEGTVKWRLHRMYDRLRVTSRTSFALALRDLLEGE
jgi:DNA-binding NarL/FixJ family response regulator